MARSSAQEVRHDQPAPTTCWREIHDHDGRRPCGQPTDGPAHLCDGHRDEMRAWTPDRQAVPA